MKSNKSVEQEPEVSISTELPAELYEEMIYFCDVTGTTPENVVKDLITSWVDGPITSDEIRAFMWNCHVLHEDILSSLNGPDCSSGHFTEDDIDRWIYNAEKSPVLTEQLMFETVCIFLRRELVARRISPRIVSKVIDGIKNIAAEPPSIIEDPEWM